MALINEQVAIVKHYMENMNEYRLEDGYWWENLKKLKLKDKKNIFVNWKDIEKQIESKKLKIEKNGFLIKQMFFEENEKLNPIIMNKQEG